MTSWAKFSTFVGGVLTLTMISFQTAQSATVLMYGDMSWDSQNQKLLTQQQFETNLSVFDNDNVVFSSLDTIMNNLSKPNQLGISFSGAYEKAHDIAMLPLLQRNIPFTIFVNPSRVGNTGYLSWQQLKDLSNQGVTLAVNPITQNTLPKLSETAIRDIIQKTKTVFFDNMGYYPKYISHPYGIASQKVMTILKDMEFVAGFGQYSGAFNHQSNLYNLPRFSISRRYGSEQRLQQSIKTEAMPIDDFLPEDPYLTNENNPPALGFTFNDPIQNKSALSCFHSQLGPVKSVRWLGNRRVEVRFSKPFKGGSSRINCTMPANNGKWYWLGQQFYVPR